MLIQSGIDFAPLYRAVGEYLSEGHAVIYSAEQASSAQVLRRMMQSGALPEAEDQIQSGALTIVDEKTVSEQKVRLNPTQLADALFAAALDARKKSGAKKVVVMCNTDELLEEQQYAKQVEFEQAISSRFKDSKNKEQIEVVCCYSFANVQKLRLRHLIPMFNSHKSMITGREWKRREWQPSATIEIIARGVEKSLDPLTAKLVFKTLKLVYKIDENEIVSNPALFEETLRRIIGGNAADVVLASIEEQIRQLMQE